MKRHILNSATTGDVWAISLEGEDYGYVRIYQGACLGVLPVVSGRLMADVDQLRAHPPRWFFGFAAPPTDNTEVFRVGTWSFPDFDSSWAPPRYMPPDIYKSYYRIAEKGTLRRAEEREALGLQKAQTATPAWLQQFILDRRKECTLLQGPHSPPSSAISKEIECNNEGQILLEIVFRAADFAFENRDMVEDSLAAALGEVGLGEVTGGGVGLETCAIDVEVSNVTQGLDLIRKTLKRLSCPATTEIHQYQPERIVHLL